MRRKLNNDEIRNNFIGIKVQSKTRKQLEFIAKRDVTPISTLIDTVLKKYIEDYFKIAHINWDDLSPEEREEVE